MTKGTSYRPTKHERQFLKGAMYKCDQREERLASVAIDCLNSSTHANAELTAVASGNARAAVRASQAVVTLAMNATRPRLQMQSYEATTSKSSGPAPPSQPVPKQLPWPNAHQQSAVWQGVWRAPQAGVWQAGVWQKHRDVWEAAQEAAWRAEKEKSWWEPPPVPRQDPGSVPPGCSVRRDGETSPPGKPPAKRSPLKPPARKALEKEKKALEKTDEATSADDGTACTDDPYMVAGAGPVHAEGKRRRLTELASTSTRS